MWIDRRLLLVVGGASLLLNVFLAGIVLGTGPFGRRVTQAVPRFDIVGAAHGGALGADDRKAFVAGMAPHRPAIRAAWQAPRAARATLEADIAAATFDRDKVAADFAALRQARAGVGVAFQAGLVDALAAVSPAGRAALVARLHEGKPAAR